MILSVLIFLPLLFALIIALCPFNDRVLKTFGLIFFGIEFLLSLSLFFLFDPGSSSIQLSQMIPWVPSWGINYFVGIDGISFWFVLLTTFLFPLALIAGIDSVKKKTKWFLTSLFVTQTCVLGSFLSLDLLLFYVFFEASLIPMYFIIGIWGGANRIYACFKFFIFTFLGSIFLLLAIIFLMFFHYKVTGEISSNILDLYKLNLPFVGGLLKSTQNILFFVFTFAFAVKVPLFPVHSWLPDAHVQAPTIGSVVLAALMLKLGTYGFLRFTLPLFPQSAFYWSEFICLLAVIGIIYGALLAFVQSDIKKLIAYSSISHMAYVVLGLFSFHLISFSGSLYQMLAHGLSTGALFLMIGMIYERTRSREISEYGGLAKAAPWFTIFFFIFCFSSMAVPLTAGFVGEFYILLGTFLKSKIFGIIAASGVVLGALYMLKMMDKVFFGKTSDLTLKVSDLTRKETLSLIPFVVFIFWMGIFPNHFLDWSKKSLDHLEKNIYQYRLERK